MLLKHNWLHNEPQRYVHTPMNSASSYQRQLEQFGDTDEVRINALETEYGFGYRQAIGELIYALTTCRPDISYPILKLSQYSTKPLKVHFEALKNIYRYLHQTKEEGIYYWRSKPRNDLPTVAPPSLAHDNNYGESSIPERHDHPQQNLYGAVDSDYAGDTQHRRSVTGVALRLTPRHNCP